MRFGGTLAGRFANHLSRSPLSPCLIYEDRTYTWRDIDDVSDRLAAVLQARGVRRGDVVGARDSRAARFWLVAV
jgi:acyl-CoA synthetase (AMP-forming)/AMP-acid ligase II